MGEIPRVVRIRAGTFCRRALLRVPVPLGLRLDLRKAHRQHALCAAVAMQKNPEYNAMPVAGLVAHDFVSSFHQELPQCTTRQLRVG